VVPFTLRYEGDLRCTAVHGPSKTQLVTDAPKDNHGKGESFSPTDLMATGLATCMMTTMAILSKNDGVSLVGMQAQAEKHMTTTAPRRIAKIVVRLMMPAGIANDKRERLQRFAHQCPVALSLHPDVVQDISLVYPD
jgi:putative redox protein